MAGTLRNALHPQRSRLILSAWLVLSIASGRSCGRRDIGLTPVFVPSAGRALVGSLSGAAARCDSSCDQQHSLRTIRIVSC